MRKGLAGQTRGHPLLALLFVLGGWIAIRGALWEPPFPSLPRLPEVLRQAYPPVTQAGEQTVAIPSDGERASLRTPPSNRSLIVPSARPAWPIAPAYLPTPLGPTEPIGRPTTMLPAAAAHEMLLLAAYMPGFFPEGRNGPTVWHGASARTDSNTVASQGDRWSFDGWVFARRGSSSFALAGLGPSYGASQAGGVIRYRFDGRRGAASAYVRASAALGGPEQSELAAGLSARPLAGVPAQVMIEGRAQRGTEQTTFAPAVALVSTLPPIALSKEVSAEVYAAGGYVGGSQSTAFFDLQAVADHDAGARLRVGAGLWAGGQKGAHRADIGPRTSVAFTSGQTFIRVAADYRIRIAGNAAPGSGPAVTISASF